MADEYIHSFTAEEQQRLVDQALFLEPYHHTGIDLTGCQRVLEVGCGVGAQLSILMRRWPQVSLVGVDRSATQLDRAGQNLAPAIKAGRVELHLAAGDQLPFPERSFDAVCVFWVFEHVTQPIPILHDIRRVLKAGGTLYTTEVFDKGLYVYPPCPAMADYFKAFTALQAEFGGDPDIGMRMAGLLAQAGFTNVESTDVSPVLDARMAEPKARKAFLDYFETLLLSGAPALLERGRIPLSAVAAVKAEFAALLTSPEAVFSYGAKRVRGSSPI